MPKKKQLSLSLKKGSKLKSDAMHLPCATSKESAPSSRWSFLSEVEELSLAKKCVPKNTATMTKWAVTNFHTNCRKLACNSMLFAHAYWLYLKT